MNSKTLNLAHNFSRNSGFHEFDIGTDIMIGNNLPIGSLSIDQTIKGVTYPNVQDAIKDLQSLYELPINSVVINTDGIEPGSVSQVDVYKFSGVVSSDIHNLGDPVVLNVFGFPVDVLVGDTSDEVSTKAKVVLDSAAFNNIVFRNIAAPITSELQVTYIDQKTHILPSYTNMGIKIEQVITSPSRPGYGSWTKIGTADLVLSGQPNTTVFYFKRVS
ncbi:baseplate wedge subunit [Acinetobacter phage 133]|uniref:Gp11 baseplate wedge completion tail pin n=1 Tax=Acinetobacter phage 133 TaxID=2919552 RepID=D9I697_9CAUD|nr:baseplate wedge subunit [Acinetobacter phage 133]ADJ19478.1 gp11 baseplate wedge completion tail pin [Acinetobacter phage 133]